MALVFALRLYKENGVDRYGQLQTKKLFIFL